MNKDVVILVTHILNKVIIEKYLIIKKQFEKYGDVFILFDNEEDKKKPIAEDVLCIQFSVDSLNELEYEPIEETIIPGSNHFILLWFYLKNPHYRYYWNIEYDVAFSGNWEFLFENFANIDADFVSSHIKEYTHENDWYWWNTYNGATLEIPLTDRIKSFNPIYRISSKALFFLDDFLKKGNSGHHEVLIPSVLHYLGYKLIDFGGRGNFVLHGYEDLFYLSSTEINTEIIDGTMRFQPMFSSVKPYKLTNKLFHPVKCDIMSAKLKVLAIVVTYNGENTIRKCLDSFLKSAYSVTIFIIDNASKDNTRYIIENEYPTAILINNEENRGFGQANNMGFKYAREQKFDYVFLLNQDAYIEENTLFDLIQVQNSYPEFDLLSPMHYSNIKEVLDENFFRYICAGSWSFIMDSINHKGCQPVYSSTFINAAAWLLTVDCIKEVGDFDPLFFHTGEDIDYYNRLRFRHFRSGIVPTTKIFHLRTNKGKNLIYEDFHYQKFVNLLVKIRNPIIKYSFASALKDLFFEGLNHFLRGRFKDWRKTCEIFHEIMKKKKQSKELKITP